MSQIAFVADRLGQQPVAGPFLRRLELRCETLAAQGLDAVDGLHDRGPHVGEERGVAGEAEVFHDGVDELALAVVLREPVGAVPVDATGDGAVGRLMGGVPADVVPHLPGASHAQQGRGRPERVAEGSSRRREANVDAPELGAPLADGDVELLRTVQTSGRGGEGRVRGAEGSRQIHVSCRARGEVEVVPQGPGGIAEAVAHRVLGGQLAREQVLGHGPLLEGRRPEPARRSQGNHCLPAIHPHGTRRALERRDGAHAAEVVEGLPRRRHLERAQGGEEPHVAGLGLQVLQPVPDVQDGLPRLAGREGGGPENDAFLPPHGRWDGKESLLQLLRGGAVSPGDDPLADVQKGLDRERASVDLEHAVFVEESLRDASESAAHRGPVGLLSAEVSGEESSGLVRGDALEERIERAGELVRPDVDLGDADSLAVDALMQAKPEPSRRAVGQVDVAPRRAGAPGRVERLPCRAVVRALEVERPRHRRRVPADDQPSVFARLSEVDQEPLRLVGGLTAPARLHTTVDGAPGLVPWQRARRLDGGRRANAMILEAQVGDPDRALPSRRRGNRELDRADLAHGATSRRSPREIDLAAPDPEGPPLRGEAEAVLLVPPDVVAARVDQLELELVGGRHPMDVEGEGISFRQWEREALARDDEATAAFEIEVEPQGAASGPAIPGNVELRLSRRHRGPAGEVGEVVENLALHGCGGRPSVARSRAARRWSAVRSDSPGDPITGVNAAPFAYTARRAGWVNRFLGAVDNPPRRLTFRSPMERLRLVPLDDTVVFPSMTVTLPLDVGNDHRVFLVPRHGSNYASVGVVAEVVDRVRLPGGGRAVVLSGLHRGVAGAARNHPAGHLVVEVEAKPDETPPRSRTAELEREYRAVVLEILELRGDDGRVAAFLRSITEPGALADTSGYSPDLSFAQKVELLETLGVVERLELALRLQRERLAELQVRKRIRDDGELGPQKQQRDYILRRQLDSIRKELGEDETSVAEEYRKKIADAGMPEAVQGQAERELGRLERMGESSPESSMIRSYLDWLLAVPWAKRSEERLDPVHAREVLDADHAGLDDVKQRIVEYLAVRKLRAERGVPDDRRSGAILTLIGPPGTGKTSIGESIARATGRKFVRMSLGGVRDEAEIRGHRRTYIGALPGRLVRALRDAGTMNPVIMLDEVDKLGADWRGDPSAALLEVLDPAQNHAFQDHYLDVELDLSHVLFIATANISETIPGPLLDRMEVIRFDGYTTDEKVAIARGYLWPRQRDRNGLREDEVDITDELIRRVVTDYTREAGVRQLERELGTLLRKTATRIASGEATAPVE